MGWDNPDFFPIGPWYSSYDNSVVASTSAVWADVGWNMAWHYDYLNQATALSNSVSYLRSGGGAAITGTYNGALAGLMPADEPASWTAATAAIATTSNTIQSNKFWYINFTWQFMAHDLNWEGIYRGAPAPATPQSMLSQPITTPNGSTRHLDLVSADVYWFTAAREPVWPYMRGNSGGGEIYRLPNGNMNLDQMQRGSNYGDMIDILRGYQSRNYPAPVVAFIENGDPWEGGGAQQSYYIQAREYHWAIWSQIIHGARAIAVFDHTFGGGGASNRAFVENPNNWYKTPYAGESISIYAQAKADQQLIHGLARIINSPFAVGYATVTPLGYVFPTPGGGFTAEGYALPTLVDNGIDIAVHHYSGGGFANSYGTFPDGFYIFAGTRASATATNIQATFTIANTGATQVTVINEGRTIPITNGGTRFVDTFANAHTVHIYRVN
jgi:hypothetical protein